MGTDARKGLTDSVLVSKRTPIIKGALIGALLGFVAGYAIEYGLCENSGCDGPMDDAMVAKGVVGLSDVTDAQRAFEDASFLYRGGLIVAVWRRKPPD